MAPKAPPHSGFDAVTDLENTIKVLPYLLSFIKINLKNCLIDGIGQNGGDLNL